MSSRGGQRTSTALALVGGCKPIARRSIARAGRARARSGSASADTFPSCAPRAACAVRSRRTCSSAFSNAATCTAASRASAAAAAATTCCSPSPARRATSARAVTRSASSPTASGSRQACSGRSSLTAARSSESSAASSPDCSWRRTAPRMRAPAPASSSSCRRSATWTTSTHVHALVADGVFEASGRFVPLPPVPEALLAERLRCELIRLLVRREAILPPAGRADAHLAPQRLQRPQPGAPRRQRRPRPQEPRGLHAARAVFLGKDGVRRGERHGDLPQQDARDPQAQLPGHAGR